MTPYLRIFISTYLHIYVSTYLHIYIHICVILFVFFTESHLLVIVAYVAIIQNRLNRYNPCPALRRCGCSAGAPRVLRGAPGRSGKHGQKAIRVTVHVHSVIASVARQSRLFKKRMHFVLDCFGVKPRNDALYDHSLQTIREQ